jgi:hypothetical protein
MKTIKIILACLFPLLGMISESANAQNCPGQVKMTIGLRGKKCACQKKCVDASEVAAYQASGWRLGDCPQSNCGWADGFKTMDEVVTYETSFTDVYPNPASSSTTIFFSLSNAQQVSFKVFDMSGRLITTLTEQESGEGDNQITWNTSDIKAGIYFLRMESGTYSEMKKVSVIN